VVSVRLGLVFLLLLVAAPASADERELQQLHADVVAAWDGLRLDEASKLIEAGLAAHPDDTVLLGFRGLEALSRGDETRARADAEAVLLQDPDDLQATALLQELELGYRARERLARTTTEFQIGTPQAHVDRLLEAIAAGASADALADAFDLEIVTWEPNPTRQTLVETIAAGFAGLREQAAAESFSALGWIVAPEVREDGRSTWVHADVVMEHVLTASRRAAIERALRDPSLSRLLDPSIRGALEPLSPDARTVVMDQLTGRRLRDHKPVEFELVRRGPEWRIRDVRTGDVSLRRDFDAMAELGAASSEKEGAFHGRLGGIGGGVLAVALALLVRSWLKR